MFLSPDDVFQYFDVLVDISILDDFRAPRYRSTLYVAPYIVDLVVVRIINYFLNQILIF